MQLEMSTQIMPLINPGLYWGVLASIYEDIDEEHTDDFKAAVCEYGEETINEILCELNLSAKIFATKFMSPREYNFSDDWLEFEMEIDDVITDRLKAISRKDDFFVFAAANWGSYDGFISFMPYKKEKFIAAINDVKSADFSRAVGMYIAYLAYEEVDLVEHRRDFVDSVAEKVAQNGWDAMTDEI